MKIPTTRIMMLAVAVAMAFSPIAGYAEKKEASPQGMTKEMMAACAAAGALNENHKLLQQSFAGAWDYRIKMWMDPDAAPQEMTGVATNTAILGSRFIQSNQSGKMQMPGPDGKMMSQDFQGIAFTGYNNIKGKFFTSWIDNMNTAMILLEGSYDPATKSFTYQGSMNCPMAPDAPLQVREVLKIVNPDTHVMEWYDNRTGKETKAMEITYTRKK